MQLYANQDKKGRKMTKQEALAKFLSVKPYYHLSLKTYDHYGLEVYSLGDKEYAIGTDKEAEKACAENIKDSLWAFNASFIAEHTKAGYTPELEKSIGKIQEQCEGAQAAIECMIEDIDEFIEDAISADGRGHFLSGYDSEENQEEDYYIYRIN